MKTRAVMDDRYGTARRPKGLQAEHRSHHTLHGPMILLDYIID
jgi:hypothetical protein